MNWSAEWQMFVSMQVRNVFRSKMAECFLFCCGEVIPVFIASVRCQEMVVVFFMVTLYAFGCWMREQVRIEFKSLECWITSVRASILWPLKHTNHTYNVHCITESLLCGSNCARMCGNSFILCVCACVVLCACVLQIRATVVSFSLYTC